MVDWERSFYHETNFINDFMCRQMKEKSDGQVYFEIIPEFGVTVEIWLAINKVKETLLGREFPFEYLLKTQRENKLINLKMKKGP